MTLPTLIFVHGGWHSPSFFDKITPPLEWRGYKCLTPQLLNSPAPDDSALPPSSNEPDIQMVRKLILAETSAGNNVVLLGHSSGGVIACSAVKGFTSERNESRQQLQYPEVAKGAGSVLGLILISAFIIPSNTSIFAYAKTLPAGIPQEHPTSGPPKHWTDSDPTQTFRILTDSRPDGVIWRFFHDLPYQEALLHVASLRQQTLSTFTASDGVYAGWQDVPVWYLICNQDHAMALERQQEMVKRAREAGGTVTTREIESGHEPFLSRPEEVVEFVEEATRDLMRK